MNTSAMASPNLNRGSTDWQRAIYVDAPHRQAGWDGASGLPLLVGMPPTQWPTSASTLLAQDADGTTEIGPQPRAGATLRSLPDRPYRMVMKGSPTGDK